MSFVYKDFFPIIVEDVSETGLKMELKNLSKRYEDRLYSFVSAVKDEIQLGSLNAKKTTPKGTGTSFMKELVAIADKYGKMITLTTAQKGHNYSDEYKSTSSKDRLEKFYSQFGFKSNYGKRTYRPDLSGNMHREPNVKSKL